MLNKINNYCYYKKKKNYDYYFFLNIIKNKMLLLNFFLLLSTAIRTLNVDLHRVLCASPTVNSVTHVLSLVVLSQLLYLQQCARLPGRRPARRRRHVSIHPRPRHLRHRAVKVKVCLTCLRYNTKLTRAKRNRRRTHTNCIEGGVN